MEEVLLGDVLACCVEMPSDLRDVDLEPRLPIPDGLELPAELPYKKVGLLRRWVPLLFDDFASTETLFQPRLMGDTIFDRPAQFSLAV